MHQRGMVASGQKIQHVLRRPHIHRQRIAQVGIEIRQAGAVDDQIHRALDSLRRFRRKPQPRLGYVAVTTSTRARRNSANFSPWCAARATENGDSSIMR